MENIFNKIKEKLVRKGFWIEPTQAEKVEKEADKNWGGNESALMRHIISQWFKK